MSSNLTPEIVGTLGGFLTETLSKLADWGLPTGGTRIAVAAQLLHDVAQIGKFPADPGSLRLVAQATRDAEEFVRIGDAVKEPPGGALRRDLSTAFGGELGGEGRATREAIQHQTQLYVGALYAHGGWSLKVPKPSDTSSPDYEGQIGTLYYGIEVKRPETDKRSNRLISAAAKQVGSDRYHGGS